MPTLTLASIKAALTTQDYSILSKPRIDLNTFKNILAAAHSPAYLEANECWSVIVARGVDPAFALAQFRQESSYGTAGIAIQNKSWGNIRANTGAFIRYKSWAAGAQSYAILVSGTFYAGNRLYNSARKLPYRYAPSADGNSPLNYGNNLVAFIGQYIALYKKGKKPVSADRATTLANAIQQRVEYVQNLITSANFDPRSYTDHLAAIKTYTDELLAIAGGAPQPDTVANISSENTATPSAPVPTVAIDTTEPSSVNPLPSLPPDNTSTGPQGIYDPAAEADALAHPDMVAEAAKLITEASIACGTNTNVEAVTALINEGKFPYWRLPVVNPLPVAKGALVGWFLGRGPADATAIEWATKYPNASFTQLFLAIGTPVPGATGENPYGIYGDENGFAAHMAELLS